MVTSDYKGPPLLPKDTNSTVKTSPRYASVAQNNVFPKKDQAIVVEAKDGVSIQDCVTAIGNITNPAYIRFASRISNGRICCYLASKQIVDELVNSQVKLQVGNDFLTIHPLISQSIRVVLSNVCPIIPHEVLEEELRKLKIRTASQINFLRVGMSDPKYGHVLSSRRQVYINPEDVEKVPTTMQINFDDTTYWVYPSTDSAMCFVCKKDGHIAKQCPSAKENTTVLPFPLGTRVVDRGTLAEFIQHTPSPTTQTEPINKETVCAVNAPEDHMTQADTTQYYSQKRPLPSNSSDISLALSIAVANKKKPTREESSDDQSTSRNLLKHTPKKTKKHDRHKEIDLEEQLSPIKEFLSQNPDKFTLNYNQLKSFLENTHGSADPISIALEYTNDLNKITQMLRDIYPHLEARSIKGRCTRIRNKLENFTEGNGDFPKLQDNTNYDALSECAEERPGSKSE